MTAPDTSHLHALVRLLDDTSPTVRRSLLSHFEQLGEPALALLRGIARGHNRIAASHAQWYLSRLRWTDPVSEFLHFIRSLNYELESGAILLGRTVYPDLDAGGVCTALDRIAARCRELMVEPLEARDRCLVLNRVLFHELGFRGNTTHYTDPDNSFLHRALERRTGLPITLSIIYMLVAERCGLQLEPVALPGHFVAGCFLAEEPFYIDAFNHGRFYSRAEVTAWLAGRQLAHDEAALAPATVRETLCRCCRNLAGHYAVAGDDVRARQFVNFVEAFESVHEENLHS